jgi:cytochrome c5
MNDEESRKMYQKREYAKIPRAGVLTLGLLLSVGFGAQAWADCSFKGGDAKNGDVIYHETCVACHGEKGTGEVPGAPDFTKKGGVLSKPHSVLTQHIKDGFHEPGVPLAMPPKGANPDLSDQDIMDVHQYLHKQFGCG